jgi:peroxiredoxin
MSSLRLASVALVCFLFARSALAGSELAIGQKAPDFTLPAATKDTILFSGIQLSHVVGKNIILLAFYPADWSGGCTTEMCTMRDNFAGLSTLGAKVLAISGDYVFSHHAWAKQLNLPFTLLSDHNHAVAKLYDSYNEKHGMNFRTVYLIDRSGKIAYKDLAYQAGSQQSFDRLKAALKSIQ